MKKSVTLLSTLLVFFVSLPASAVCAEGDLTALIKALDDEEANVRMSAIRELGARGKSAAPAASRLVEVLIGDESPLMVNFAQQALADIGGESVPHLTDILSDPEPRKREVAAITLGNVGPEARDRDAVKHLAFAIGDSEDKVSAAAEAALSAIGIERWDPVLSFLRERLKSEEEELRRQAVRSAVVLALVLEEEGRARMAEIFGELPEQEHSYASSLFLDHIEDERYENLNPAAVEVLIEAPSALYRHLPDVDTFITRRSVIDAAGEIGRQRDIDEMLIPAFTGLYLNAFRERWKGRTPLDFSKMIEGARLRYALTVPFSDSDEGPKQPAAASAKIWPGGFDLEGLQPVVFSEYGESLGAELLWDSPDEPILVIFDTGEIYGSGGEEQKSATYYLYLWEEEKLPGSKPRNRHYGLILETKNLGEGAANEFDSSLGSFARLWSENPGIDDRSLLPEVNQVFHVHRNYGYHKTYLPNRGAPLSLNRYAGYFEVSRPSEDEIRESKEEFDKLKVQTAEMRKKDEKLSKKIESTKKEFKPKLENAENKYESEIQSAKKALEKAEEKGNSGEIRNRKAALEEWKRRRRTGIEEVLKKRNKLLDDLENKRLGPRRTVEENRRRIEFLEAAISEIKNNTYTFAIGSAGPSWLLIDGEVVFHWSEEDRLSRRRGRYTGFKETAINLKPGMRRFEYLYASSGRDYVASVFWKLPGRRRGDRMRPETFRFARAEVEDGLGRKSSRPIAWKPVGDTRISSSAPDMILFNFSVPCSVNAPGIEQEMFYRWDFGDGDALETDKKKIEHLYLQGGHYDVVLEAFSDRASEELLWRTSQTVHVHPPWDPQTPLLDIKKVERMILEKDLSQHPAQHLLSAIINVEELDPDRVSYNDWRRHVLKSIGERADELAEISPAWTFRAGNACASPMLALYSEALSCYRAASAHMEKYSPEWHRARLMEAGALARYGRGEEALEILQTVEYHRHCVFREHLKGWWTFSNIAVDEQKIIDYSNYANHGELVNEAAVETKRGDGRGAIRFSENAASVRLPVANQPDYPSVTISMWLRPDSLDKTRQIVTTNGFTLFLDEGVPSIRCTVDRIREKASEGLVAGEWQNLTLVRKAGSYIRMFLDGKNILERNIRDSGPYVDLLRFAGDAGGRRESFEGALSDVRVFDKALDEKELSRLLVDDDWNRIRTEALMAAGRGDEAIDFIRKWRKKLPGSAPDDLVRHGATFRRIRSLIDRGSSAALLEADDRLQELLQAAPERLVEPSFNILMLDMYLGSDAYEVAYYQAKRILSLDLNPTHRASVMAQKVIALSGLEKSDEARRVFAELEGEYPYSSAIRRAREALGK